MLNSPEYISLDEAMKYYASIKVENEEEYQLHLQLMRWLEELKFFRGHFYIFEDNYLKFLNELYKNGGN